MELNHPGQAYKTRRATRTKENPDTERTGHGHIHARFANRVFRNENPDSSPVWKTRTKKRTKRRSPTFRAGLLQKKKNARPALCDKVIHKIVARYDMLCHVPKVTRAIRDVKRNQWIYISYPESKIITGGVPCIRLRIWKKIGFKETMSKRRKGYPSETKVKRGFRQVHGEKELLEKLGRRDPCPCGSGRRFQELLLEGRENGRK